MLISASISCRYDLSRWCCNNNWICKDLALQGFSRWSDFGLLSNQKYRLFIIWMHPKNLKTFFRFSVADWHSGWGWNEKAAETLLQLNITAGTRWVKKAVITPTSRVITPDIHGFFRPLKGVITPRITGREPPCSDSHSWMFHVLLGVHGLVLLFLLPLSIAFFFLQRAQKRVWC